jgi:hypothetical protein
MGEQEASPINLDRQRSEGHGLRANLARDTQLIQQTRYA